MALVLGATSGLWPSAVRAASLLPRQATPKRLLSTGDSITRAFDAALPADNLSSSWVSGTRGFIEQLFGLPDVKSHNQRISANFGSSGRTNIVAAVNGADMPDLFSQVLRATNRDVTYATILMGGNDVCNDRIDQLTTDRDFEIYLRIGLTVLAKLMNQNGTIQVVTIPDIKRLYDIGKDKTALGVINCELLWSASALGFPCGSMLSPENSEADRLYVQSRNRGYNDILRRVASELDQEFSQFIFVADTFNFPFVESDVSNIDCFHPSWRGQKKIASHVWDQGPFRAFRKGS